MRKSTIACMACAICVFLAFVPVVQKTILVAGERSEKYEAYRLANVPQVTLQELQAEYEQVRLLMEADAGEEPEDYFRTIDRMFGLMTMRSNYAVHHKEYDPEFAHMHAKIQQLRGENVSPLQARYQKFGSEMTTVAQDYQFTNKSESLSITIPASELPSYEGVWHAFQWAFLLSLIPAFVLNILRLNRQEKLVWPEFASLRIVPATFAWPVLMWFYPTCIVRREQLVLAGRATAYALSAAFSFGLGVGPVSAQTNKKDEKKQAGQSRTVERDLSFEIKAYPLTPGSKSEYVGPTYYWKAGRLSGLGFAELGRVPFLSNHILMADTPGPVDGRLEVGYGPPGVFSYFGPQVNLNNTPVRGVTEKVFRFATCAHLFPANEGMPRQNAFFWKTQSVTIGKGFSLLSEGWYRARIHTPDIAQLQLWLQKGGMKLGIELGIFGEDLSPRFGVKYAF